MSVSPCVDVMLCKIRRSLRALAIRPLCVHTTLSRPPISADIAYERRKAVRITSTKRSPCCTTQGSSPFFPSQKHVSGTPVPALIHPGFLVRSPSISWMMDRDRDCGRRCSSSSPSLLARRPGEQQRRNGAVNNDPSYPQMRLTA